MGGGGKQNCLSVLYAQTAIGIYKLFFYFDTKLKRASFFFFTFAAKKKDSFKLAKESKRGE